MKFGRTFKALSDPVRRDILNLLKKQSLSAGDICKNFNLTKPTISYHLKELKNADLIYEKKFKNFIYYDINTSVFEEVLIWLSEFGGINKNENET